jgi:hypothetical protein
MNRIITSGGLAAGGAMAAAFLSTGIAAADDGSNPFGLTPAGDLNITSQTGDVFENIAYGTETFNFNSEDIAPFVQKFLDNNVTVGGSPVTLGSETFTANDLQTEVIDKVAFGGQGEQQVLIPGIDNTNIDGSVIDIHDFGHDFGYVYIDLVGPGPTHPNSDGIHDAIGTWLVTPLGTFDVSSWEDGTFFGGLAYLESQLFDLSGSSIGTDFSDTALTPVPALFDVFGWF